MSSALLTIVARGTAIITELVRLVELVPGPYKNESLNPLNQTQDKTRESILENLICDFSYFKLADAFEARIEANEQLKRADEELCDNYIDILTRFYLTFESVYRYAEDLNNFIEELEEEAFVGETLEGLLDETESRQLLCEAYFLLGYMLITTDNNFEGGLRERLIVSFYRYSSYKSSPNSNLDNTCNLMRSTGFRTRQQQLYRTFRYASFYRPNEYPESLFARVGVNESVVNLLLARMQSTDIYNQTKTVFPHPDHRTAALSQQASMLYVILYFCPNLMISQKSRMREIADKFFADSWIISLYMGEIVNLLEAWSPYKAARESLIQLFEVEATVNLVEHYCIKFNQSSKHMKEALKEGWLTSETAMSNHVKIINLLRDSNVTMKWMLLHSRWFEMWQLKLSKTLHSIVINNQPDGRALYMFLQNLSELEKNFYTVCDGLLETKQERIQDNKQKVCEMLEDLVDIFKDAKPMRWIQPGSNSKLASLLQEISGDINSIDFVGDQQAARGAIVKSIGDIESARESYSDGKSLQVAQLFTYIRETLILILKLIDLNEGVKVTLQSVGDFSYGWRIMDEAFTGYMQQVIKDDPMKVYGIESIFMKMTSSFDPLLFRIQQINSKADLISVSQYYSTKLVSYIRDVLQIIPATILELVSQVIAIQTNNVIGDMPAKVSLDSLKEYALPEKRFELLELTYKISHYAEGLMLMQNTTIGLVRVNSQQLLDDGIRRELVKNMSDSIQQVLQYPRSAQALNMDLKQAANNLLHKLTQLDSVMNGYKRSFEYIQDYLFIYGIRIWQEELGRIVKFNAELASLDLFSRQQEGQPKATFEPQTSLYQSTKAPIPIYGQDGWQSSFISRTLDELLRVTEPRATIYDEQMSAWYEQKASKDKVIDLKVFELIGSSLSAAGLNGLDQVCCTLLMTELQMLDAYLISLVTGKSSQHQTLRESLEMLENIKLQQPHEHSRQQSQRVFASALAKMAPYSDTIVNYLLRIGQLQAIRSSISCVISTKCRNEARSYYNCLETLNGALLSTLRYNLHEGRRRRRRRRQLGEERDEEKSRSQQESMDGCNEASQAKGLDTSRDENDGIEAEAKDFGDISGDNLTLQLEDSQLIFELTNHLEWVGLSDTFGKIYTLSLQESTSSEEIEFREKLTAIDLLFLILLNLSSKFRFSRSTSGFLPKLSEHFYESNCTIDGQPLFYGLVTLINHYSPFLTSGDSNNDELLATRQPNISETTSQRRQQQQLMRQSDLGSSGTTASANTNLLFDADSYCKKIEPLARLLELMSLHVKCSIGVQESPHGGGGGSGSNLGAPIKTHEFTLEVANMILSIIELLRLSKFVSSNSSDSRALLAQTYLPEFVAETFQFTICNLSSNSSGNGAASGS